MRRAFGVLAVLGLLPGGPARAGEPPLFLPGDRTTSRVDGEMKHADESRTDGVYGRFAGLYDLGIEGGAEFQSGGTAGALRASLHYLFMAGIYAEYSDAFGQASLESSRTVSFG